jgi:phosphatidylglycerophosphatase C
METNRKLRHSIGASAPVVAFDFDGTLTRRDSFIDFLLWRAGAAQFGVRLASLAPAIAGFGFNGDRGALKAAVARRFIGGLSRSEIEAETRRYRDARFDALMRPDALIRWRDWATRGVRLFIVTASPDILVAPFARALGADGLIATRLAFDAEDRFTGAFDGLNCRGPEKVARLRRELGSDLWLLAAYGDSRGDREMLAIAETPGLRVFGARP